MKSGATLSQRTINLTTTSSTPHLSSLSFNHCSTCYNFNFLLVEFGQASRSLLDGTVSHPYLIGASLWWVSGLRERRREIRKEILCVYCLKKQTCTLLPLVNILGKVCPIRSPLCCYGHWVCVYVVGLDLTFEIRSKLHHNESFVSVCLVRVRTTNIEHSALD